MKENEGATAPTNNTDGYRTRSGRISKPPERLINALISIVTVALIISASLVTTDNTINESCKLFTYPATIADNDTMYLKEAMQQQDRQHFLEAMIKEIDDHTTRGHWRITNKTEMREKNYNYKPIMAIWSFKRKRNPMGEITKYKARLCCHGGQTLKGVHYNKSFSPVVAWSTVRTMLTLAIINDWHARQIDFVLAFPQAKVRADVYMQVPEKFKVCNNKLIMEEKALHPSKQYEVVKLIQNVYGLVDASYT